MKIVYIVGPMTGLPAFNYPAFYKAEEDLKLLGYQVINPARLDGGDTSKPWLYYIERTLHYLPQAQAIYLLRGWQNSYGAWIEVLVAQKLGKEFLYEGGETR